MLDLFCCAGGAGMGYRRAGFRVVGFDLAPQPNYPFEFHQGDALALDPGWIADNFDAVHLSPPCQGYTALAAVHGNEWPKLIEPARALAEATGLPYVIENVQGAPLRRDLTLCGEMFGLRVIRHRYFELGNWTTEPLDHIPHRGRVAGWRHGVFYDGPYFAVYGNGGGKGTVPQWQDALGIDWTADRHELAEAIPPAYTELIGSRLLTQLLASY